jgi:hypothetical protein
LTSCPTLPEKGLREGGKAMNMAICAVIFFLGGVATVIVMRLLFLFLNRPLKGIRDDQYLKQIANALQLPEFGKAEATPRFLGDLGQRMSSESSVPG